MQRIRHTRLDGLSPAGANELAQRIFIYWLERGFKVEVWVEPLQASQGMVWVVKSDLVDGHPRA